jgi:ATP adenylyltransferase
MNDDASSTERKSNIWAPWRMEYINGLSDEGGCFLCRYRDEPAKDAENLVLWRGSRCFAVLNRFPYTGGHSMVAPLDHVPGLGDLDDATMLEMMGMLRDLQQALEHTVHAQGFNVGINIGRCAGAGLPGHLHLHIVPRWNGDTNFMAVFGDVRVIPQSLESLYAALRKSSAELNLPRVKKS